MKTPRPLHRFHAAVLGAGLAVLAAHRAAATAYVSTNAAVSAWTTTTTWSPNGTPTSSDSVRIQSGTAVSLQNSSQSCASLMIEAGGTFSLGSGTGSSVARPLTIAGSLTNYGTMNLQAKNSTIHSITFTANGSWVGSGNISSLGNGPVGLSIVINSGVTLDVSGVTNGITLPAVGAGATNNAAFTVNGTLIAGATTIAGLGTNNLFTLASGATLVSANVNGIAGTTATLNYTNGLASLSAGANYTLNGTSAQATTGLPATINNLTNNNSAGVTLSAPTTVTGTLGLTAGKLTTTAANLLTLAAGGSAAGASSTSFVSGPFAQVFTATGAKTFPIGTNSNYRPVTVNLTTLGTNPATLTVTPHEPSTFPGSTPASTTLFTARDWTVTSSAASGNAAILTVDGSGFVPTGTVKLIGYDGAATTSYLTTQSGSNYTSQASISLTASSDFALGDVNCSAPPVPVISSISAPACSGVTVRWGAVSGATSYNIYRKLSGGAYGAAIANVAVTNYSDADSLTLANGSNYVYAVSSLGCIESAKSADSSVVSPVLAPAITAQPASATTADGYPAAFALTAVNAASYRWQVNKGGGFANTVENTDGTGSQTAGFTTVAATTGMNGYQFRCVVSNSCGAVTSSVATLSVATHFRSVAGSGVKNFSDSTTWQISVDGSTGWVAAPVGAYPGASNSVEIQSGSTVIVDTTMSCGSLTLDSGGALENVATPGQNTLNLYGNLVNNNSGSGGFAAGGSSATKLTFVSGSASWTGSGDTSVGKFYVTVNSGVTLDISGLTTPLKFKSGSGTTVFTVNGKLIGGTQTVNANGNVNNTFVLGPGATLQTANTNGIFVSGSATPMLNYVSTPTLDATATYIFNGGTAQVTAGLPAAVSNLTVNNAGGVTLSAPCMVNSALTLSSGTLATSSSNLLTLASAATLSGTTTNRFIKGPLARVFSGTAPITKTFPVAAGGTNRPVSLSLTTIVSPSTVTVTPHEPTTFGGSIPAGLTMFTKRNWSVASSAASGNVATLTVDGTGFSASGAVVMLGYDGSATTSYTPTVSNGTNYTVSSLNLTSAGDFALGNCVSPSSSPKNLSVSTPNCTTVSLSWSAVNNAAGYNVYRKLSTSGSYGAAIGFTATTNYSDPTALNSSTYNYAVAAVSACGGEGPRSSSSGSIHPSNPAYIITQPASVVTSNDFSASFKVYAVNRTAPGNSNQWQFSANGGSTWLNVTNGTGGTATNYVTAATTTNMSGFQYRCVLYGGCAGAITSAPATLTVSYSDPYAVVRQAWLNKLLADAASAASVSNKAYGYWSTMNTNVSRTNLWSDLPLGSVSANMVSTFTRLQALALAYAQPENGYYANASLAAAVASGLDWMNTNAYKATGGQYDNWFHWEISGPQALNSTEILVYSALTTAQISNYCAAVDNYGPDSANASPYFDWGSLTGANTADAVLVTVIRGALAKSNAKLTEGQTNLSKVFPFVTSGDGFYDDGSFVFHGNVAYNGGYGLTLLEDVANLANLLSASPWAITDPNLANIYAWITNGTEPFLYNGAMMDMVRGRNLTTSEFTDGSQALAAIATVAQFAPGDTAATLNDFLAAQRLAAGQFHFNNMDRVVALRDGFGFGLSMSSSRIANYENETAVPSAANNMKGWNTGDGMTYLYVGAADANFTDDYWATVDYYHLPGTTSQTNWNALPNPTDQNWVGGAEVGGNFGVAGMALHPRGTNTTYSTLVGKKSWFMFDGEIVCLGAGITCGENNRVDTTVENRRLGLAPTNNFWVNGALVAPVVGWSSNVAAASWCALDGVGGYYFPGGATNLFASLTTCTGKWTDIHPTDSDASTYTNNYLKLYFQHGLKPTNSTYAYVLLPNLDAAAVSNYASAPGVVVLTNTAAVQAVSKPALGVVAANFWNSGNASAGLISVNNKSSVITCQTNGVISVGVADPTQTNTGSVTVTLNVAAAGVLTADSGVTVLQTGPQIILSVNMSGTQGKTFQASFSLASYSASTDPASNVYLTTATLNGTVNPNGAATTAWFRWGATTNYGNTTAVTNIGSGYSPVAVAQNLASLTPYTTYHYQFIVTNVYGMIYGDDQAFTTVGLTNSVSTLDDFQAAINAAHPGDTVILANGGYTTTSAIVITNVGTSNAPIMIQAEAVGGAGIGGSYGFDFQPPAAWVTVQGFCLTNGGDQIFIRSGTSHCRLSRNIIQCVIPGGADQAFVRINGDDALVDYNEIRNKNSVGQGLDIQGDGAGQVARRLWVHHNYFHDFVYQNGTNGCETVRWGVGGYAASAGDGLMEYNLFDRCDGEPEMVSIKSCNNVYRFNAFLNTANSQFKLRTGTNNAVYGNYFSNTLGLCIYNYHHQVFDNYFINNAEAIQIGNGDTNVLDLSGDATHTTPRFCVIAFNTLINNTNQYWMATSYTYGAQSNTFANNLIVGSALAADFNGQSYLNGSWSNNLIWNTTAGNTSPGDMPAGAYTKTNPLVTLPDAYGVLHLQSNSPAIGAAAAGYANVTVDMDGQPRPATGKDIGADQFSTNSTSARFLTTNDVGPFSVSVAGANPAGFVALGNLSQTYDGTAKSATATTSPAGLTVAFTYNGSPTPPVNVGSYTVVGTISDPLYSGAATNTLQITAAATPIRITSLVWNGGNFSLAGSGPMGQAYRIVATTNLAQPLSNWTGVATGVFSGGVFSFSDGQVTNYNNRYYRAISP